MRWVAEPVPRRGPVGAVLAAAVLAAALAAAAVVTPGATDPPAAAADTPPARAAAAASPPGPTATAAYPPTGLDEASGLAVSALHPGVVWVVEDGGEFGAESSALVEAFDRAGARVGSVQFEASDVFAGDNRDTEALAMGPGPTLWSADIGDNNAVRETVLVHSTPEPTDLDDHVTTATSYRFTYPDGPRDAEAFLVDPLDGRAYIASKTVFGAAGWYVVPVELGAGETHELTRVQDLPALVTDGAFSPDGSVVALRTLGLDGPSTATLYDAVRTADGAPVTLAERAEVALPEQQQGESLTFTADGSALLVGSEGATEPIWAVPLPADAPGSGPVASSTSASPAAQSSTGAPTSGPAAGPSAAAGGCGLGTPTACLADPAVLLVALVLLLLGLVAAIVALRRRA